MSLRIRSVSVTNILRRISKDPYLSNELKLYTSDALYQAVLLITTGPLLQTFMLEMGISADVVSRTVSVFQVVQGSIMLLCASLTEKIRNVPKVCAALALNPLCLLLVMLFFSITGAENAIPGAYVAVLVGGCITNVLLGLYNVLVYKRPYHIMDMSEYGRITANGSVIIGIFGMLISFLLTFCLGNFSYFYVIRGFSGAGTALVIAAAIVAVSFRKIENSKSYTKPQEEKMNLFRYKPFYILFVPNLLRGIGTGVFGVAVTIGYYFGVINSVTSSFINIAMYVGTILSGVLYVRIARKWDNAKMILAFSVLSALSLPLMLIGKNAVIFIAGYAVSYLAINIFGTAIPVSVPEFVDYHVMGRYTAWRMMLHTVGIAIGGFLVPIFLKSIGGIPTLLFAGSLNVITGVGYYCYLKSLKKEEKN